MTAVDDRGVLAPNQCAECRPQRSFQIGRLQDDTAQRALQSFDIHATQHRLPKVVQQRLRRRCPAVAQWAERRLAAPRPPEACDTTATGGS